MSDTDIVQARQRSCHVKFTTSALEAAKFTSISVKEGLGIESAKEPDSPNTYYS